MKDNPMDKINKMVKAAAEADEEDTTLLWEAAFDVTDSMWKCFEAMGDIRQKAMAETTRDLGFEHPDWLKKELLELLPEVEL